MSKKPAFKHINRREFVRAAAAAGGLAFVTACGDEILGIKGDDLALGKKGGKPGGGKGGPVDRYPLNVPSVHEFPGELTLNCAPARVDLGGEQMSDVWAYNGSFPGPTLRAARGDRVNVILQNNLLDETITHWHGMVVDHLNDGHPMHAIQPGAGPRLYDFSINQRAALNWYHPHPHELTGEQVNLGLAGAFIIEDSEEAQLNLPTGAYEVPLIIRDAKLDRSGNLTYTAKRGGFSGDTFLVNGTLNPRLEVDRTLYRFRILNGSNARIYRLALDSGHPWLLIGNDGGLLANAVGGASVAQIDLSPAERLDILIDFRGLNTGDKVMLQDLNAGWDLLEFEVTGAISNPAASFVDGQALSAIDPLVQNGATRTFSFDGMSRINGQQYEMDRIDERVPVDSVEKWIFTTNGNAPHPVHVHAAPFQVISRTGGRNEVFPWERGWKDTVLLEDGETVEVLVYFRKEDYLVDGVVPANSIYLMHCHKLEHEDMGMMMNWELYDPSA